MKSKTCNNLNCQKSYLSDDHRSKYCSRSCSASVNNTLSPKRKKKLGKCKYCSNSIFASSRRTVCDQCLSDGTHSKSMWKNETTRIDNLTVGELKRLTRDNQRPWTDRVRSYARSRFPAKGKICKCGYNKHVELCHIKSITSFSDESLLKDINNLNNIMYLCPRCHWEFDNL
jgi:hypothetical protein